MTSRRGTAVAIALLGAALATAGCGVGQGGDVGEVSLTITRDYGSKRVSGPATDEVTEADTAMRVLDRNAGIVTRYGGAFVQSIDGIEGARRNGNPYDWFFYVNGLWAPVGAADYSLHGGEAIWWDYRNWSVGTRVSAVVGSWPQPFASGYEGGRHPTTVECLGGGAACAVVQRRLQGAGAAPPASGAAPDAIRVLVGPWPRLREDPDAGQVEDGAQVGGVFAEFERTSDGLELVGLDEGGEAARRFGAGAGLVAATRRYDRPPVWIVSGATARGVRAAAGALDASHLRDHYAVAVEGGEETPLPVR